MGRPLAVTVNFSSRTHSYYRTLLRNFDGILEPVEVPAAWDHPTPGGRAGTWAFWKARAAWQAVGGVNVDAYPRALVGERPFLSAQSVPLNRVPWAIDVDVVSALTNFRHAAVRRFPARTFLRRRLADERCRAIVYWSEIARRGTERLLRDERLPGKGTILYPAADPAPGSRASGSDRVRVLFVGKRFELKGGPEAVEAAQRVLERHPHEVEFLFVTNLPPSYTPPRDARIRFVSNLSDEELAEAFRASDAFLFPTYFEVFGVVTVEALSYGLPVVTLDEFAIPEVVTDGVDGFVVPGYRARWYDEAGVPLRGFGAMRAAHRAEERRRIVDGLADAVATLVRDPGLRGRMADAALDKCRTGRFSSLRQRQTLQGLAERLRGPA